jgi:hypothetical protein
VEELLNLIQGAAELCAWFGYWPDFHDADIITLALNRKGVSTVQIYTWHMAGKIDDRGYLIQEKQVLVNFRMEEILSLSLSDFSDQNVIFGLSLSRIDEEFEIRLDPCYGISGTIAARKLSVDFEPVPTGLH